ncbi:MAG: ABC transporter ATP-binding protein [Candidatus Onthovivens sp.]|nr:ABC transporter ATP-binding protein [Candidatus Onthovivens sp.]
MKKSEEKVSYMSIFKELLKSVREFKKPSIIAIVLISLEALFECFIPFVMSMLVNLLAEGKPANEILSNVFIYASILVVLAICSLLSGVFAGRISAKAAIGFATNLRKDIYDKITTFSFTNIDKFSVSSLVTRQTLDISYIQNCYMMSIRIALRAPLMFIFSIIMTLIQSPQMSWIFAITIPILLCVIILVMYFAIPLFNKLFKRYDSLNESIEENVRGIRVVKTYVREEYEKAKFDRVSDDLEKGFIKAERIVAINNPAMNATMSLSFALIVFFGSMMILNTSFVENGIVVYTDLKPGHLSSLITYGAQMLSSLMMFSMVLVMFTMSLASMRRIYEVLTEEPTIKNIENPKKELSSADILFKNVSFKYSEKAEKAALSNINLTIKEGQTVGIIGGTGSSKSTLVNLISRFYDVSEGELLIGGENIKNYDIEFLRNNIGMVLQKNVLFSGTIKENLKWGDKNATDEEIIEACKIAQADSFIQSFPDKYDTHIEQGGSNVSGGQKQRLCIARAIIKKPRILILDDSTSAVDTKTDALIRKGLKKSLPNSTKIIIAQRLSSVQDSDFIVVLDDGKIIGVGSHDELMQHNETYREIYNIQNRLGGDGNEKTK